MCYVLPLYALQQDKSINIIPVLLVYSMLYYELPLLLDRA